MARYEYKLVPAPAKANKIRGLKGADRFAATLEEVMNTYGAEGWQFMRADTLPQEERSGLTSSKTVYRTVLVFQRELEEVPVPRRVSPSPDVKAAPAPTPPPAAPPLTAAPEDKPNSEP